MGIKNRYRQGGIRTFALLAAFVLVASACGDDDTSGPTADATTSTTSVATTVTTTDAPTTTAVAVQGFAPGTYKLGYLTLETGTLAFAGVPSLQAVELALEQLNASGELGDGVVFELVTEDGGGDQATAIAAVELLLADDDIVGLICCSSSSVTGAIKPLIDAAGMPTSMVSAVLPTATEGDFIFRPKPPSASQYALLGPAAVNAFGMTDVVVTRTTDNDGMVATAEIFAEEIEKAGANVTFVDLLSTDTDLSGPATAIIDLDPDAVFHAELASTLGLSVRELVDRGYVGPHFGTGSTGNPEQFEIAGTAMAGVAFALPYFPGAEDAGTVSFVASWEEMTGEAVPPSYAAEGFTAALMVIEGLKNAAAAAPGEAPTRASLLAGMTAVNELLGTPQGDISFNAEGQGDVALMKLIQWDCTGNLVLWDGTAAGLVDRTTC